MEDDVKREARRQYLKYFRIWFIGIGILLAVAVGAGVVRSMRSDDSRGNNRAPKERVYDEADVLTDQEEEKLRKYIARKEKEIHADFVIRTISRPVEGQEALRQGCVYTDYGKNMFDLADTFWEEEKFGYDKSWEGDGSILLDNCYPGQEGVCISTSGKIEDRLSKRELDLIQDAVYDAYGSGPYKAYVAYIDGVCKYAKSAELFGSMYYLAAVLIPLVVAGSFAASHLSGNKARKTVAPNAYVVGGKPVMRGQSDDFVRKHVTQRKIETSSSGGSRSSGGGGGHHVSRGGASHGGSVRRR